MATKERNRLNRPVDRHLDVPQEANRDKHINFRALEQGDKDAADDNENRWYQKNNGGRNQAGNPKPGESEKIY